MIETIVGVYLCIGLAMFIETFWHHRKQIKEKLHDNDLNAFPLLIPIAATLGFLCGMFVNVFLWPFLLPRKLRKVE